MKKIIALLLIFAFLLPTLAACGDADSEVNDNISDTSSDAPTEKPTRKPTAPKETKPADFDDKGNITLDGWTDYVIVKGSNCSSSEATAANELRNYIKRMSGVTVKIVPDSTEPAEKELVVGKTNREAEGQFDREELGDEGFVIQTVGKKLFIAGGELRGTLYGVYTYLENYLGCRFYTANFEKIPEYDALPFIEIEEDKQIPIFESRSTGWRDYSDHTLSAKLKINGSHGRGTMSDMYGGNPTWAGSSCHTLYKLAEMEGNDFNHEPCLSDEQVYQTVLKNVRAILAANPNASYISVSQNDSDTRDWACKCEKCNEVYERTGSRAGMYLTFVNRIAEEIKDEYPNVMIHTFAYKFTKEVPTDVKPADNVMVQFCTIEACFRHPLDQCTNAIDKATDFKKLIEDWSSICNYLAVWDYTTNFSYYNLSFPNFEAMYHNIQLFADHNVKYVYEQGDWQGTNGEFSELRGYLLSRLLWDPYMSKEQYYAYMDEFLFDYYGEGGAKIKEYMNLMLSTTENTCATIYASPSAYYPNTVSTVRQDNAALPSAITEDNLRNFRKMDWTPYYEYYTKYTPNELLSRGEELFNEAYELASTPEAKARVEKSSIQVLLLRIYFENERIKIIEEDMYKLAFNLAKSRIGGDDESCAFVAHAISAYVAQEARKEFAVLNRSYYDLMMKHNISHEREGDPLKTDGKYDFTKTPREWTH